MIPYGRQEISQEDIDAVVDVLTSDFLTQGPRIPAFEEKVAKHVGAKHAIAVNSATSALHIACRALHLGPGDSLWTSPITFVASANCGLYCGAKVDFVDINPKTYNLCPMALEAKLERARDTNSLPKVLVAVHLCGQPCEMERIHALCTKYGIRIIEDASHAIGAKYKDEFVGNGRYSDITVFSFHPVKIITTAEGGMALTNDCQIAARLELFRSHGITRDSNIMIREPDGPWYYEQIELGYNYRMTDLQAALGISQMNSLESFVDRRRKLAARYDEELEGLPIKRPFQNLDCQSAYHLYVIRLRSSEASRSQLQVFKFLRERGIGVNIHYIPVHLQPYYRELGHKSTDFPQSVSYYKEAISLPMYQGLSNNEQDLVVKSLKLALAY